MSTDWAPVTEGRAWVSESNIDFCFFKGRVSHSQTSMADKSICNFTGLARCQEGGLIIHRVPGTALGVRDSIQGRCCRLSAAIMQSSLILKSVGVLYTCGLVRDLKITHTHTHRVYKCNFRNNRADRSTQDHGREKIGLPTRSSGKGGLSLSRPLQGSRCNLLPCS